MISRILARFPYGIDDPKVLRRYIFLSFFSFALAFLLLVWSFCFGIYFFVSGLGFLYPVFMILRGSMQTKFREIEWLIEKLELTGEEKILDIGCGRGALTVAVARKLKQRGNIIAMDIWSQDGQLKNHSKNAYCNFVIENINNRVRIVTADARNVPFVDNCFDVVVSSWCLHNIEPQQERQEALKEIDRILRKNGKIAILDVGCIEELNAFFKLLRYKVKILGPRYTFGTATYLFIGQKI